MLTIFLGQIQRLMIPIEFNALSIMPANRFKGAILLEAVHITGMRFRLYLAPLNMLLALRSPFTKISIWSQKARPT
ncbi:hypothetical protein CPT76_01335 [Paenibacillus sp. AR247]|nr:hypothetical protein CPT76_01335 [Paenibacillus sp. AR247]